MPLIIDTDPGIDDMLALLLLLATPKATAELKLISLTYGNCALEATLVNALSLFYVVGKENEYRATIGLPEYTDQRPIIALGSRHPLNGVEAVNATDVHGNDGLGGSHQTHPEYTCPKEWVEMFSPGAKEPEETFPFRIGRQESHLEILDILRSEPENTVTILAVGPLTNVAKAAAADPQTFSRVKEILSMGGAVRITGNITPAAEFNVFADPLAASIVYALTSLRPQEMLPTGTSESYLQLPKPLDLTIFPLDITTKHVMTSKEIEQVLDSRIARHPGSWLLKWVKIWTKLSLEKMEVVYGWPDAPLQMHDPLTAAYSIDPANGWTLEELDIRVESAGSWCLGKTLTDDRSRGSIDNNPHDYHRWHMSGSGNKVKMVTGSPYPEFGSFLLETLSKLT
ncbi:Inosine-uridine preferring nucleoside hydrolase [Wickerhamiella sorbophila]|uniref:Inosine-uridine preferring nucleoside hydrolase n=1 Tax=Wickerhamiella sorbophila TaxID=45607 RepID=A0A2T0FHD1_9ASCO|nr:Inosine-uridine preferring nucleoside hydrolase [Wickerhamiella sorbophila]PRT54367.1 Inosine-uridine preferring nucleoside hydrolase [Wickerhamiella sorbophila]